MKKKLKHVLALLLVNCMLISQFASVYTVQAEEEYPTSTSNAYSDENVTATIDKSAAWNNNNAADSDYKASITINANAKGEEEEIVASSVDIVIALDNSGSMAKCSNTNHATLSAVEASWLTDDTWNRIYNYMTVTTSTWPDYYSESYWFPEDNYQKLYVWEDDQANNTYGDNTYYLFLKNTNNPSPRNPADWYIGQLNESSTLVLGKTYVKTEYHDLVKSPTHAPYSYGHVELDSNGTPIRHIAANDNGVARLSVWREGSDGYLASMSSLTGGSYDGATTDLYKSAATDCEYVFGYSEESAINFIKRLSDAKSNGLLGDVKVSVIGFAGQVNDVKSTKLLDISDSSNVNQLIDSVETFYSSLGAQTNWENAMFEVKDVLGDSVADNQVVVFYTDGCPDLGDSGGNKTIQSRDKSYEYAQDIYYDTDLNATFYGIFMRNGESDATELNSLISSGNTGRAQDGNNGSNVSLIGATTPNADIYDILQGYWDDIYEYITKRVVSKSVTDTVSDKFTIGSLEEILEANPSYNNSNYTITVEGQTVKITINNASIEGVENFVIPVTLKEEYRNVDELTYYPTNEGDATIVYTDLNSEEQTLGTKTPYLPVPPNEESQIQVSYEWVGTERPSDVTPPTSDIIDVGTAYNSKPQDPTNEDYIFDGWYLDQELTTKYVDGTELVEDTILYGSWTPITIKLDIIVTYEWVGEDRPSDVTPPDGDVINTGTAYTSKLQDATNEAYTFDGWYLDQELTSKYVDGTVLVTDTILYGKWTPETEETINVTYEWVGEDRPSDVTPPDGDVINSGTAYTSKAQDPTYEDYTFDGWYLDQELTNKYVDGTVLVEDTILYGMWTPVSPGLKVVKSSDPESNTQVDQGQTITYTMTATNNGAEATGLPTIVDYIPYGTTYVAGSAASNNDQVTILDQTGEAGRIVWNLPVMEPGDTIEVSFAVTVDIEEGTVRNVALYGESEDPEEPMDPGDVYKETNEVKHTVVNETPIEVSYEWVGEDRPGDVTPPTSDIINTGTAYTSKTQDPTNEAYTFDGWYEDQDLTTKYVDGTVLVEDTILYGKWTPVSTPEPNLEVVKSSDPANGTQVKQGQTIKYTLTATNTGEGSTGMVTIVDKIPEGTTYVVGSASSANDQVAILDQTAEKGRIVWNLPVMNYGDTIEVSFEVTVNIEEGTVKNVALYGDSEDPDNPLDPDTPDKETNEVEHPVVKPNLKVVKSSDPDNKTQVKKGQTIEYKLTATNTGEGSTGMVTIVDNIPEGTTYVAGSAKSTNDQVEILDQTTEKGRIVWNLPAMKKGDTIEVSFEVTVNIEEGTVKNVALYGDSEDPDKPLDPDTPDKETNEVEHPVVKPGLNVIKSSNPKNGTQVKNGDTIKYTLTASNTGEGSTGMVTIVDNIPEGTTYVAGSAKSTNDQVEILDQTTEKGRIVWNLPAMKKGDTIEVSFEVTVNIEEGTVKNVAVYGDSEDPDKPLDPDTPDKETNEVENPVVKPSLNVVKSADPENGTQLKKGDTITYTLTASNTGKGSTGMVTIVDNIPEGTTYVAGSAASANDQVEILDQTEEEGRIVWNLPAMKQGDTIEVSFQVTVNVSTGTVKNAAVYGDSEDPDNPLDPDTPDKETNVVKHPVVTTGLSVVKSSDPKSGTKVKKGQTITYTLTASNTGKESTGMVTIVDEIPEGTTYVAGSAKSANDQVEVLDQTSEKGRIVWNLPAMKEGDTIKVSFQVTVNVSTGTVKNVAAFGDSEDPNQPLDPDDVNTKTNVVKHPVSGTTTTSTSSSGKTGSSGTSTTSKTSPVKTGDTTNILMYCVVMLAALGLLGFTVSRRRNKKIK